MITLIGPENFEAEIAANKQPVLLAYINRDHHYRKPINMLQRVAERFHPLVQFLLLDRNRLTALDALDLKGSPTFIIFMDGQEKGRLLGLTNPETLSDFIMRALPDLLPMAKAWNSNSLLEEQGLAHRE